MYHAEGKQIIKKIRPSTGSMYKKEQIYSKIKTP